MKKGWLRAAAMLLVSVLTVNITWYGWRAEKYSRYIQGMRPQVFCTVLDPCYYAIDEEGYDFSVAYPAYLSTTGNLCVGAPAGEGGNLFTDALIIWPEMGGGYSYGLLLYDPQGAYQIMMDGNGTALDSRFDPVVQDHAQSVAGLFQKANQWWELS